MITHHPIPFCIIHVAICLTHASDTYCCIGSVRHKFCGRLPEFGNEASLETKWPNNRFAVEIEICFSYTNHSFITQPPRLDTPPVERGTIREAIY